MIPDVSLEINGYYWCVFLPSFLLYTYNVRTLHFRSPWDLILLRRIFFDSVVAALEYNLSAFSDCHLSFLSSLLFNSLLHFSIFFFPIFILFSSHPFFHLFSSPFLSPPLISSPPSLQVRKLKAKESDMIKLQLLEMSDSLPPLTKFSYGYKFDPWQRRGKYVPSYVYVCVWVCKCMCLCLCASTCVCKHVFEYVCAYVTDWNTLLVFVCVCVLGCVGLIRYGGMHILYFHIMASW
jgi:hypothetical protein